eukprot:1161525-Pelagomonas_calceolata.AAC.17
MAMQTGKPQTKCLRADPCLTGLHWPQTDVRHTNKCNVSSPTLKLSGLHWSLAQPISHGAVGESSRGWRARQTATARLESGTHDSGMRGRQWQRVSKVACIAESKSAPEAGMHGRQQQQQAE